MSTSDVNARSMSMKARIYAANTGFQIASEQSIAFDDQPPQIRDILANNSQADWETSVKDSVRKIQSTHTLATSGDHV